MHCRREGRISLVLHSSEAAEIEVIRATGGLGQRRTPGDHKRSPRNPVETLVGRSRYGMQACIGEIDSLRSEAADAVNEQTNPLRPAQLLERLQVVEPPGCRLMVHNRNVREL